MPLAATYIRKGMNARVQATGLVFCLTHNYTGYPMVRQAKAMVANGELGEIRLVQVEYVQGGRAKAEPGKKAWKEDPVRGGPSLVFGVVIALLAVWVALVATMKPIAALAKR